MCRKIAVALGLCLMLAGTAAHADEVVLTQLYGSGVHAFNRRDYVTAYRDLTAAIEGGTIDPRAYYFRGLALIRLGRGEDAVADFTRGGELEVGEAADVYPVNKSLERVQGPDRITLDRYRKSVRVSAMRRIEAARQARYQQQVAAEREMIRRPPSELFGANPSNERVPDPTDPFSDKPAAEGATPPVSPPVAATPSAEPPTTPDASAAPSTEPTKGGLRGLVRGLVRGLPGDGSPQTDSLQGPTPSPPPPMSDPMATPRPMPLPDNDDPFGTPAPAPQPTAPKSDDNPFGEPAPAPMPQPSNDNPFGEPSPTPMPTPKPADDNPFGETTPAPATPAPQPAPADDNPFGEPAPPTDAPKPMDDNPFGG